MKPIRRKVLRFGVQFVPLFALFLAIYAVVLPGYERAVQATANVIMGQLSPASRVVTESESFWAAYTTSESGEERQLNRWALFVRHLIYLNLALLPALLLATPTTLGNRLRILGIGVVLMFVGHVLAMTGLVRGTMCLADAPMSFFCNWMLRIVYTSGQLFAAVIWGLLSWRYWFHDPDEPASA